jgi:hypothetical protein
MSVPVMLYLMGSSIVLVLLRLGGGPSDLLFQAHGIGWLLIIASIVNLLRSRPASDGAARARRWFLVGEALGALALLGIVGLALDQLDVLGLDEEGRAKAQVVAQSGLALLWFLSTIPLFTVDRVQAASPVMLPIGRVSEAGYGGLSVAFAIAMLFPLNYLAHENNVRWDHSYFKTSSPGDVTVGTLDALDAPIQAWLFFPSTSDVTEEVRTYFDQIQSVNLEVAYVDQALEAELAKELKVQKNGTIALVRGTGEDQQVQRIRIGDDLSKAERKLKKLDEEVSKALLKLAADPKQAYITVGHGEMYWKKSASVLPARTIQTVRDELKRLNFKVTELGAAQGLASEVPEDADLVLVMGPTDAFMAEELTALDDYRSGGGALMVALDPGSKADMSGLLTPVGLSYSGESVLVGETNIWVATRRPTDRYNIFTNKVSTHPSVTTLSRNSRTRALLTPLAAPLTQLDNPPFKVEITVRSLDEVWLDQTRNLRFDRGVEERKGWPLAAAISGAEDADFRMVVMGDSTWASDLVLPLSMGNQEYLRDSIAWLVAEPSQGGTVNNEEDVKIRHTKKDDAWMFYGSTMLIPIVLLGFGMIRVRSRRKEDAA